MARERSSPELQARRQRAFELYLAIDEQGKRPTLRSIAHRLGVTLNSVMYWRKHDDWDKRLQSSLNVIANAVAGQQQNLKALLRVGSMEAVTTLRDVVNDRHAPIDDRIKASQALFKIAKDAGAIDLDLVPDPPVASKSLANFDDHLPAEVDACHSESTTSLTSSEMSPAEESTLESKPALPDSETLPTPPLPLST